MTKAKKHDALFWLFFALVSLVSLALLELKADNGGRRSLLPERP